MTVVRTRIAIRLLLPVSALIGVVVFGGCATSPSPTASVQSAPAPATAIPAMPDTDSGTPIPDLDDAAPAVQWSGLTITQPAPHYDDLWDYLGQGFTLDASGGDGRVQGELNWFAGHGEYLQRVANRAQPYLYYIVQQVEARKMPLDIALLPVVESAFDPFAYSNGRAAGLWQFVPATGKIYDLKQNWWYDGRRDVAASTQAALGYLQFLHDMFGNDWLLALAAYNSGPGTVQHAIAVNQRKGLPTDFWHLDLPAETRAYVPRLLAICQLVADPRHLGVDLPAIPNSPYLAQVDAGGQIDLGMAAKLSGLTSEQMYLLNPGFNRWATDPDGPYTLFVPMEDKDAFLQGLDALPPHDRVQWDTHRVQAGDTVGELSRRYHTTVAVLEQLNGLHGHIIRVGQTLLVPVARQTLADSALHAEMRVASLQDQHLGGGRIVHKVRNGESLWSIAQRYHVTVSALRQWNRLAEDQPLRIGYKLVIWPGRRDTAQAGPPASSTVRSITYTVRAGDSLSTLSTRFGVTVSDIAGWNGLDTGDYLQPGQQLKLQVDVTRQGSSG